MDKTLTNRRNTSIIMKNNLINKDVDNMEKETFDGNDIEVTETETSEQQVSEETEKPHKWRKPLLITLGGIAG